MSEFYERIFALAKAAGALVIETDGKDEYRTSREAVRDALKSLLECQQHMIDAALRPT